MDGLEGLSAGLYVFGEVHKVWDKTARKSGEVKYYARFLVDEEPGTIQVNVTDLPPADIRYLAMNERETVLVGLRYFVVEGNLYFKAVSLVTPESLADGAVSSGDSILADLKAGKGAA